MAGEASPPLPGYSGGSENAAYHLKTADNLAYVSSTRT